MNIGKQMYAPTRQYRYFEPEMLLFWIIYYANTATQKHTLNHLQILILTFMQNPQNVKLTHK